MHDTHAAVRGLYGGSHVRAMYVPTVLLYCFLVVTVSIVSVGVLAVLLVDVSVACVVNVLLIIACSVYLFDRGAGKGYTIKKLVEEGRFPRKYSLSRPPAFMLLSNSLTGPLL